MQWIVLFFQHLKMLCHLFLALMVSDENLLSFKLCSPLVICHFSPATFDVFLFSFSCLIMMYLLDLSLSYLWFTQLFEPAQLYLLLNLKHFHPLFLCIFSWLYSFFLLYIWVFKYTNVSTFVIVPQITEVHFPPIFLLLFRLYKLYGLFSSHWFNLVISTIPFLKIFLVIIFFS